MNTKKIGNTIYTLRKSQKLSQANLAEKLGITPQAISKWENGDSLPETYYLPILSKVLGISIDELLSSEEISKPKGDLNIDNIVKGIEIIYNLKEYFGEDSLFTIGAIIGLNNTMNFDFNNIYENRKAILY